MAENVVANVMAITSVTDVAVQKVALQNDGEDVLREVLRDVKRIDHEVLVEKRSSVSPSLSRCANDLKAEMGHDRFELFSPRIDRKGTC